jgi:hydroxypyruvate isomerase
VIWSAHLSTLFRELPYLERPQAAAEAGFTAVETWWPDGTGDALADETARLGLDVALLNAYGGDLDAGERGFLNVLERREEALAAVRDALELAERCGARKLNVLVGREAADFDRRTQLAIAADALNACAALVDGTGVTILVEPLNELDVPGSLVPTPADAAALLQAVASPHVRLLYDAYHAARAGGDPCVDVRGLAPLIGHVQFADCPGRGAPGSGELDLDAFVRELEGVGYDGAVGLEFFTDGPTADALGFLRA